MQTYTEFKALMAEAELDEEFQLEKFVKSLDDKKLLSIFKRSVDELQRLKTVASFKEAIVDLGCYIAELEDRDILKID